VGYIPDSYTAMLLDCSKIRMLLQFGSISPANNIIDSDSTQKYHLTPCKPLHVTAVITPYVFRMQYPTN